MINLNHYFDLKVIPDAEMHPNTVLSFLFGEIHHYLLPYNGAIGLGFPAYGISRGSVGGIIRLFGDHDNLQEICKSIGKSTEFSNYAVITEVKTIPEKVRGYYHFHRVREKGLSDLKRAEKRLKSRGEWSLEIKQRMVEKWDQPPKEPYLNMKSSSTGKKFSLWIGRKSLKESGEGKFNSYGLGIGRAVPDFLDDDLLRPLS